MIAKLAAAAALLAAAVRAECPNGCSQKGTCGKFDQCECYPGYMGGDCSQRVCPFSHAFVDSPLGDLNHDTRVGYGASVKTYSKVQWSNFKVAESWPVLAKSGADFTRDAEGRILATGNTVGGWQAAVGEGHFLAECSGKGSCDRKTGQCTCFDGYSGGACQRTVCPNDCSGHGLCRTVGEIARGALTASAEGGKGVSTAFDYSLWDAQKNRACVCDKGYAGVDCSLRTCPKGNDPLTFASHTCGNKLCTNAKQAFSVDGGQGNAATAPGTYVLEFTSGGVVYKSSKFALSTDNTVADWASRQAANEAAVKHALESIPGNVTGRVTVKSGVTTYGEGGSTARDQLRIQVAFDTLTGPVAPMRLLWRGTSNAATRASFVLQPSQPVQVFRLTPSAAGQEKVLFRITPLDQSQAGRAEYWLGSVTDLGVDLTSASSAEQIGAIGDKIAEALNSIPFVRAQYGAPFVRDSNVLVSQVTPSAGSVLIVKVAFDLNMGTNALAYQEGVDASALTSAGPWTKAELLADVVVATSEALPCSNRGLCDETTGTCQCFRGYFGLACETQSALAGGPATSPA